MEMLIIVIVVLAAFAAVLLPLFRRRPGYGDESLFENIPQEDAKPSASAASLPGDDADVAPAPLPGEDADVAAAAAAGGKDTDTLEFEVLRYRAAVRAGTVCRKCGQANPAGSIFCFECGVRLPLADAKEFE